MPGTRPVQPLRPRAAAVLDQAGRGLSEPRWSLDLRLYWDSSATCAWVTGSAWSPDGDDLLELPLTQIRGGGVQEDVIALLRALWADRANPAVEVQP